jgi:hypothetical protein
MTTRILTMMRERIPIDRELARLLESAKATPPIPDVVRARVMARAATASRTATRPAAQLRRRTLVALAASVTFVAGATGVAVALLGRHERPVAPVAKPAPSRPQTIQPSEPAEPAQPAEPAEPAMEPPAPAIPSPKPRSTSRPRTPQEFYAAELDLLYRSHSAYASGDFGRSLTLLSEHGRRFPKGQLTEEREALRVRALAGAGQTEEAKRASEAFARRFPHSLLLPR